MDEFLLPKGSIVALVEPIGARGPGSPGPRDLPAARVPVSPAKPAQPAKVVVKGWEDRPRRHEPCGQVVMPGQRHLCPGPLHWGTTCTEWTLLA